MPDLSPRRLTGRTLRLTARLGRRPVVGSGIRTVARPRLGLARLRAARLGDAAPLLAPPPPPSGHRSADDDGSGA